MYKKSETQLTASVLKKDPKHTRDGTGQNVHIFEESLFFKLHTTIQQKTVKPTYLVSG